MTPLEVYERVLAVVFGLLAYAFCQINGWTKHDEQTSPRRGFYAMSSAFVLFLLFAVVVVATTSFEDVPNSSRDVTATVSDMVLDTSAESNRVIDESQTLLAIHAAHRQLGIVSSSTEPAIHVSARYSVLLEWDGGRTWLPVEARVYRRLMPEMQVQLRLHEQRMTCFITKWEPDLIAGPIVTPNAAAGLP